MAIYAIGNTWNVMRNKIEQLIAKDLERIKLLEIKIDERESRGIDCHGEYIMLAKKNKALIDIKLLLRFMDE